MLRVNSRGLPLSPTSQESSTRLAERQSIARDLHDSTSQTLVVLQLQLGQLKRLRLPGASGIIADCDRVIGEIRGQIRALDLDRAA